MRVGFYGAGGINRVHAAALGAHADCEIVAVCSQSRDHANKFSSECANGSAATYTDPFEMLRQAKLDVLYVAVPPGSHAGEVEEAARRGVHLMLEKPIALTVERAELIQAAVHESGVVCEVGFQLRHSSPVVRLRNLIDEGRAGRPLFLMGRLVTNSLYSAWWRNPALGGGQLVEQAIHLYDLARYCLGEPLSVGALVDNLDHRDSPGYEVDDVSAAIARFSSGAIASISASNCGGTSGRGLRASLQFEHLVAEIDGAGTGSLEGRDGQAPSPGAEAASWNAYEEQTADFLRAVRTGSATRSSVDDGVEALRFVLAARRSAERSGEPVSVR